MDTSALSNSGEHAITTRTTSSQRRVDHTYRDFSNFPLEELPTRKRAPSNFPSKLHQILSNPEFTHIISWMPHGRAWKIHNKDLLIRDIVPKYFVQSKYESFTRQLNGWGFKRLHQSGNDFNAYYHECFLRGMPHLTVLLKRVTPNQGKLLPHVEGEPNFYEIDKQFPLRPPMMVPFHAAPHPYYASSLGSGSGYYHGATSLDNPASTSVWPHSFYHPPSYPLHPPYFGQPDDPNNASAAIPHMSGYPSYHSMYPSTPYGYLPQEQYPHNTPHYPTLLGHPQSQGAQIRLENSTLSGGGGILITEKKEEVDSVVFQGNIMYHKAADAAFTDDGNQT